MHREIRSLVLALILLLLAAGAVQARPLGARPADGLFDALWSWAALYLGSWNKEGGMMDPNGLKAGVEIDPNGLQRQPLPPGSTSDSGGTMDPNG